MSSAEDRYQTQTMAPVGVLAELDHTTSVISECEELLRNLQDPIAEVNAPGPQSPLPDEACSFIANSIVDFSDLKVEDVLSQIKIADKQSQNRLAAFFGNIPYKYGKVSHSGSAYPKCKVMDTILARMRCVEPDFSFDNYTCLVMHYPDGSAGIPLHSDSQQGFHGSTI